jgi:hypothetical protein
VERIEEYGFPSTPRSGFSQATRANICTKNTSRQIYFGLEVDEKLLPFAIEEFGDRNWVYGSD